jgi:hypothetical protein
MLDQNIEGHVNLCWPALVHRVNSKDFHTHSQRRR